MTKPRIGILRDKYAIENGQPWACIHAGCCARGVSPVDCYTKLMNHFKKMREMTERISDSPFLREEIDLIVAVAALELAKADALREDAYNGKYQSHEAADIFIGEADDAVDAARTKLYGALQKMTANLPSPAVTPRTQSI